MEFIYGFIAIFGTCALLVVTLAYFTDYEFCKGTTTLILTIVVASVSISGLVFEQNKIYATEVFNSGAYKVDTTAVIENCEDKVDAFAITLVDNGVDTCYIEPNISRWDLEYVCTIPKKGEDTRIYLRHKDIKQMVDNEFIKFVES